MSQVTLTASLGGAMTSFGKLSRQMRQQAEGEYVYRQFVDIKEGPGLKGGDILTFKKSLRTDTRGTKLSETGTIPTNHIKYVTGTATVSEWGQKWEYTGKLEKLSQFDLTDDFQRKAYSDIKDTHDNQVYTVMKTGMLKAVCSAAATTVWTTNGTATVTATVSPTSTNMKDIVDQMRTAQIPTYKDGGKYIAILGIKAMRSVFNDIQSMDAYTQPHEEFNGEVGSFYKTRYIPDDTYASNAIGNGSALGEGFIFGDEAILEVLAMEAKVVHAWEPKELGRTQYVGWWSIVDWYIFWNSTTDDLNSTGKGIDRVVHITSA